MSVNVAYFGDGGQLILEANKIVEFASAPRGELKDELKHWESAMYVGG